MLIPDPECNSEPLEALTEVLVRRRMGESDGY
jgi:hypothetical protein